MKNFMYQLLALMIGFYLGVLFISNFSLLSLDSVQTSHLIRVGAETLVKESMNSGDSEQLAESCELWNTYSKSKLVMNFNVLGAEDVINTCSRFNK